MRALFDRRLTDPTADEVAETLRACVATANAGTVGDLAPFDADAAGERLLQQASGHAALTGDAVASLTAGEIARLSVAWWTSPSGRKLVRIRGWREIERRGPQYSPELYAFHQTERELAARPVIWHLEPERVVETFTAGDPEWVAVCGCGVAGSAESLGWHHGMCGPCADRVAEYGVEAVRHAPGLLTADNFEPRDVVFSGNGRFVVATGYNEAGSDEQARVWDTPTGALKGDFVSVAPVDLRPVASPDGRYVFFGVDGTAGPFLVFPECELWARGELTRMPVSAAYWTGRPNQVLVQAGVHLYLVAADSGSVRPAARPSDGRARLCALHPHPERPRAVFAHNGNSTVTRIRDDGTLIEEWRFLLGHGRLDRTGMWNGGPQIVRFSPDGERILFVRGTEVELRLPERSKALQQVEFPRTILDAHFSGCGEWVYFLTDAGIHVCHLGMLANVRARLRWHVGAAARMAVSPDGRTLATAGPEGVKLWAVETLLPLLE